MAKKKKRKWTNKPKNNKEEPNEKYRVKSLKDLVNTLKKNWKTLAVLMGVALLVYANILNGEFVTADDPEIIKYVNNYTLKDALKSMYLPNIYVSVIHEIFGLSAPAYHTISVIIHLINIVLAFSLMYVLTEDKNLSALATLIFCIHPAGSEAVVWNSGRAYLFLFFFTSTTLISYLLYRKSGKKDYLALATVIFIIALFFWKNPWSLIIPFLIVGIDQLLIRKKIDIKKIKTYIPFAIVAAAYGGSTFLGKYSKRVESLAAKYRYDPVSATPLINRIPYTIYMAVRQLVWPIKLTIYHEGTIITKPLYTFMILIALAYVGAAIYLWKKDRTAAALMILLMFSILPTFSPVVVAWFIADRYLYFGSLLFGYFIVRMLRKIEKEKQIKDLTITTMILLTLFFGIRTAIRTNDFKTNKNLWLSTKKVSPYSRRVYNNLGDVYSKEKNWPLAIENFKKSIEISPNYAEAIHNLGFTYMQVGDFENAKKYLTLSYQKNPTIFQAMYKLGLIARHEGDLNLALEYMNMALEVVPGDPQINRTITEIQQQIQTGVSSAETVPVETTP